jgi:uncharacterized membrane protein YoaK (UPF0700 family)
VARSPFLISPTHPRQEPHAPQQLTLILALTFAAGIVDAVGYLALDHVFIGNMTGNIVTLGMAVAGGNQLPITGPFAALLCFALGAAISGLVLRRPPDGHGAPPSCCWRPGPSWPARR